MPNFDLTFSPSQIEFVLKPGVTFIQAYQVTNNSTLPITLTAEVLPWVPSGTNGSVNYDQAVTNSDIQFSLGNSDIQMGQSFTIAPNSSQQLVLKIKTNPNMSLSDNYYTFFVSQNLETPASTKDNFSQASGKIGSHVLLTVSDVENPRVEASVQNFSISPKIKDVFFGPITFQGQVKNNSNFFFKINGKITITKNDNIIKEFTLNSDNVLNHHSRNFSCFEENCQLNAPFWPGSYKVSLSLDQNLNAKTYETTFFVFPISPIIFILLITGIILGYKKIKKILKNRKSKPISKSTQPSNIIP